MAGLASSLFATVGCGRTNEAEEPEGGGGAAAEDGKMSGEELYERSEVIFDVAQLETFDLTVEEADLAWLKAHAVEEIYVPAQLSVAGEVIGQVGLRYKGAYSLDNCFEDGVQTCSKVSMKIKFNEYDPELRFHGLKKLAFEAPFFDPTHGLRERLGNKVYEEMGVLAARTSHAQLTINGLPEGLFTVIEQVDGRFTDTRFDRGGDGNLYKEAWPDSTNPEFYADFIKTNEDTAEHTTLVEFATELLAAADADLPAVIEKWMDTDHLLAYMAVDIAINNWDGIRTFYAWDHEAHGGASPQGHNHNFYLYQEEHEPRFWLIPWDLDNTWEVADRLGGIPAWDDPVGECGVKLPAHGGAASVTAPNCDPLLRGLATVDRARYVAKLQELLDGPLQIASLEAHLNAWVAQMAPAIEVDPYGPGLVAWEIGVQSLRDDLPLIRAKVQNVIDGVEMTPLALPLTAVTDFENANALDVAVGVNASCNATSQIVSRISSEGALGGEDDLMTSFSLRDEPGSAWGQWTTVRIGLEGQPSVDLSAAGVTGLRFKAQADQTRNLRIDFDSPACDRMSAGICLGWEFDVTATSETFEMQFADATLPDWAPTGGTEELSEVLADAAAVNFRPHVAGRDGTGYLGDGVVDEGWLRIDDIEFLTP